MISLHDLTGHEMEENEKISIFKSYGETTLILNEITADDSGKYVISVNNNIGNDCFYASLSVEGPPDPPSGKPSIHLGDEMCTITWCSSPYDGGRAIDCYIVEVFVSRPSTPGGEWRILTDKCHSLAYSMRNLVAGCSYVFRIRAVNVHGASEAGLESDAVSIDTIDEISVFDHHTVCIEPGPEFTSRYSVQEELGKGRYGVVHLVMENKTNSRLAAKFVRCRTAKDRAKVHHEIDIMNSLRHPKLLQLQAAFEMQRDMVMVMEYISGGELFERVVADDFSLTERDCILFLRQICEGVSYMHSLNIVHLDLKPENIMCHTRTSHQIKVIDFGLAQRLEDGVPVRVLFGTPEFIPPEIINYEPIGVQSDLWSIGVICYVLLSGLSPFMGDNDAETFANITRADYDFNDEAFDAVSEDARDFIKSLLIKRKESRLTAEECLKHKWMTQLDQLNPVVLSTDKLKKFIIRRKWQKTGNAIRAVGRMATLSASRRNSNTSNSNSPRPSLANITKLLSLDEEENKKEDIPEETKMADDTNETKMADERNDSSSVKSDKQSQLDVKKDDLCRVLSDLTINKKGLSKESSLEEDYVPKTTKKVEESSKTSPIPEKFRETTDFSKQLCNKILNNLEEELDDNSNRNRACSERSDSGISDCSIVASTLTTNLLRDKNLSINEDEIKYFEPSLKKDGLEYKEGKLNDASQPSSKETSVTKFRIRTSESVANRIKKFSQLDNTPNAPNTTTLPRKPAQVKIKRTQSMSPTRFKPRDHKLKTSVKCDSPTLKEMSLQETNENVKLFVNQRLGSSVQDRKKSLEKHIDTSSSFLKAAAFWNKM